jgi:hypothetical protein
VGRVINSERDDKFKNWKYEVEGKDLANDQLNCITVFIDARLTLLIITGLERG